MTAVSMSVMRQIMGGLLSLTLLPCLWAQASPDDQSEQKTIQRVKRALASSLDASLPKVTLENFLNYESEGAEIHWEVNDCGEESGNPATDAGRDFPMCVEVDFEARQQTVSLLMVVGTVKKGVGNPAFFSGTVDDARGKVRPLRRLGDLPKELHRPMPRSPRDFPDTKVGRS